MPQVIDAKDENNDIPQDDWRERFEVFLQQCSPAQRRHLQDCALTHDEPGWTLCRRSGSAEHLLIIGAGWGRQVHILTKHFKRITVIESSSAHHEFLTNRFAGVPAVTVLTPSSYINLAKVWDTACADTIFVRSDFTRHWKPSDLAQVLDSLRVNLSHNAELIVETWRVPALWRAFAKCIKSGFHNATFYADSRYWGRVAQTYGLAADTYYVEGPHWNVRAYTPEDDTPPNLLLKNQRSSRRWRQQLSFGLPRNLLLVLKTVRVDRQKTLLQHSVSVATDSPEMLLPGAFRLSGRGIAMPLRLPAGAPVCRLSLAYRARQRCRNEERTLLRLHHTLPAELNVYLPVPRVAQALVEWPDIGVYIQSRLSGEVGTARMPGEQHTAALEWLAGLHTRTCRVAHQPKDAYGKLVQRRLKQLVNLGQIIVDRHQKMEVHEQWRIVRARMMAPPWGEGIVVCATHGDYRPQNLLFESGTLCGVIDWETASFSGLPVRDLYWYFMSTRIAGQHRASAVYAQELLKHTPSVFFQPYSAAVPEQLRQMLWHPWYRVIYPLERLMTVWDGYDLRAEVEPNPMARDWLNLLTPLADYVKKEFTGIEGSVK